MARPGLEGYGLQPQRRGRHGLRSHNSLLSRWGCEGDIHVDGLKAMYSGMMDACEAGGCAIAGGDIVRSDTLFVTVALQGVAGPNEVIAHPQRGVRGRRARGYRLPWLLGRRTETPARPRRSVRHQPRAREYLTAAHNRPNPRTQAGQTLRKLGVRCAMDVSDGLVADVEKLCATSKVSASIDIDSVPVHPFLKETFPDSWSQLALTGGEDYELVFTANQATMRAVVNELGELVKVIGRIEPGDGSVRVEDASGREIHIESSGWNHFAG